MTDSPILDRLSDRSLALGPAGEPDHATRDWRLRRDEHGVAWLLLDCAERSANVISGAVLEQLDEMLGRLEAEPPNGLVIRSAKPHGFAVGADIEEFRGAASAGEVEAPLRRAHAVVDRLEAFGPPTVAVVHGPCLGAGLEIALACDARIAVGDAMLGFPEVMLGLHPGLGGTFRSTSLIDPAEAMTLMLTGKSAHANKASKLGLVDVATDERHVAAAVRGALTGELKRDRGGLKASALGTGPGRRFAAGRMRSKTAEKARPEHYPAPFALIDLWEKHGGDRKAMQEAEIGSFARLMVGETAQNLIRVFFLRERLRNFGKEDAALSHIHVIGAGEMGGDIAGWCALKGLRVTVADLDPKAMAKAVARASKMFEDQLHSGAERRDARDRLIADFAGDGLRQADIVIEAIAEKVEAKRKLYADIEPRMNPGAVLASNTSSIPFDDLREGLERPGRLCGLHFFNPVARMQLIEVVSHDAADEDALRIARAFCGRVGKLPAPVRSAPGFLVNRILTPYVLEALVMLDEGARPETLDRAAEEFGMAMGPIAVADQVGLDIAMDVADKLRAALGGDLPEPPAWARGKIKAGKLGKKTGEGLYVWEGRKPRKDKNAPAPDAAMTDRLILPMVNASAACLREGVVDDPDVLDASMIFAAGFAPFRGGPAHYARTRGIGAVREALEDLARKHGDRFAPDPGLDGLGQAPWRAQ